MTLVGHDPEHDDELQRAVALLLKLDAEGCRIVAQVVAASFAYGDWEARNDDAALNPYEACQDICRMLIDNHELADELGPLVEARVKYLVEAEAAEDEAKRRAARYRRRLPRRAAAIVRLVPDPDPEPSQET